MNNFSLKEIERQSDRVDVQNKNLRIFMKDIADLFHTIKSSLKSDGISKESKIVVKMDSLEDDYRKKISEFEFVINEVSMKMRNYVDKSLSNEDQMTLASKNILEKLEEIDLLYSKFVYSIQDSSGAIFFK